MGFLSAAPLIFKAIKEPKNILEIFKKESVDRNRYYNCYKLINCRVEYYF